MTSYTFDPIHILNTSNTTSITGGGSFAVDGGASVGKNLYVGGNLNISGTTTSFSDNIIVINQNPESSVDTGILLQRYSTDISNNNNYAGIIYSETNDEFVFSYLESDPNKTSITFNNLIPIKTKSLIISSTENTLGLNNGGGLTIFGGASINKSLYVNESITTNNLYLTGNLYQNGSPFSGSSQWNNNGFNIYYTQGNVGIGTSNPSYNLHVDGNLYSTNIINTNITSSTLNLSTGLTSSNAQITNLNATNSIITNITTNTLNANINNIGTINSTYITANVISAGSINLSNNINVAGTLTVVNITSTNLVETNISAGIIYSQTLSAIGNSNTIGSIFTTGGNIGIGLSSPAYQLDVNGTIRASGDITAFSDVRFKTDIKTIDNALNKVNNLRGVYFKSLQNNRKNIGVIAQETESIIPEAVLTDENGHKSVAYGNIVGILIEAIKEISSNILNLQNEIDKLKTKNNL